MPETKNHVLNVLFLMEIACFILFISELAYDVMKNNLKDQHNTQDVKPTNLISHGSKSVPNDAAETPIPDSGSVSVSSNGNRKVSREDIEFVRCYVYTLSCSCFLFLVDL